MKNRYRIIQIIMLCLFATGSLMAQAPADTAAMAAPTGEIPTIFYNWSFYYISFLFIVMFIAIVVMARVIKTITKGMSLADAIKENTTFKAEVSTESFWQVIDRKFLTKAVPIEQEADVLLNHDYDGIRELDNALPPWWVWGFYITIIFAFVYFLNYQVLHTGVSQAQEYTNEVAQAAAQQTERNSKIADMVTPETVTLLTTPEGISAGKETFIKNCAACHGQNGEGIVGPNLTDEFWIHGGGIKNVFTTVTNGYPTKGMISWKSQLSPKKIQEVASFVLSLQGTKPANGKAPQGDAWVDTTVTKDSIATNPAADSIVTAEKK